MSISIVIRALNEAAHLPKLFEGLASQTLVPKEIILVDSGSTDDTIAIGEQAGASVLTIDPSRFTFGRALNMGCNAASGEFLVFVSAHTYPANENWLKNLIVPFEEHDDVALVYGHQSGNEQTIFSESEILRKWFPSESDINQGHPFCNNANCAIRASVWDTHPYDEKLTGLEDVDWAFRVQQDGYRIWYEAGASIVHVHQETFEQTVNRYRREAIAHKRIFDQHRIYGIEAIGLFVLSSLRDYISAVSQKCLLENMWSIPRFRFAQFLGTWRGFRQVGEPSRSLKHRFYYPRGFSLSTNRDKTSQRR